MSGVIVLVAVASALFGAGFAWFAFNAWLSGEKRAFLRSPRALQEAHEHLGARVAEIKAKRGPRRWFGKKPKKGRA